MQSRNLVEEIAMTASRFEIQRLIVQELRRTYDLTEPIPERLAELLNRAEGDAPLSRASSLWRDR
jgi:hypothetical protein